MKDYQPVSQKGDEEGEAARESTLFIGNNVLPLPPRPWWRGGKKQNWRPFVIAGVILLSNLAFLLVGGVAGRLTAYSVPKLDRKCAAHTTQNSPVLDVGIHYAPVHFNGSFMNEDNYRKEAAPEVDAAWEALGVDYRASLISREEGLRSGLTNSHVQRADQYGGGFLVNVEGMHHLHCLNLLRQALYYNYPYYKNMGTHAFKNDGQILKLHVSHCVDTLRQVLMCNVDTGVLGQVWFDHQSPTAFPDFHTTHTCKNYEAVRKWAEEHQAPPVAELPPNYLQAPHPEDIWELTP